MGLLGSLGSLGSPAQQTVNWRLFDYGPKKVRCPIVFLPPVSGTPDVYFKQLVTLGSEGFRVIAVRFCCYFYFYFIFKIHEAVPRI